MDIVDPQAGGDPHLAKPPTPSTEGEVPKMEMERVLPRQQSTGLSRGIQQLGSQNVFVDSGDEQIIVAKNSVNQVLMGNQANFGEGFYVTKEGIDAKTANKASDFIFNSNQNVFKVVTSGTAILPAVTLTFLAGQYTASSVGVNVNHGLSFLPVVIASTQFPGTSNYIQMPHTTLLVSSGSGQATFSVTSEINTTTLSFYTTVWGYNIGSSLPSLNVKYYLLQETAN